MHISTGKFCRTVPAPKERKWKELFSKGGSETERESVVCIGKSFQFCLLHDVAVQRITDQKKYFYFSLLIFERKLNDF